MGGDDTNDQAIEQWLVHATHLQNRRRFALDIH